MPDEVITQIQDRIQTLRINRPAKKNALTAAMYDVMTAALKRGDASNDVAVHVFLGTDGVFSAGNDINDFLSRPAGTPDASSGAAGFIRTLPAVQKPMIAAVDGIAIGVGATMLLHCDLVYASPRASLRTPFLDLGLVPEAASSLLGPMRMGPQRAFELLCLGEPFDAERALAAGLINRIVPAAELEGVAMAAARRLAAKPPQALAAARKLLRGDVAEILERIDQETVIFAERLASEESQDALRAFLGRGRG